MGYKGISDFRSDTVTRPTEKMRKAMYEAEVGDDVLGDDPTVAKLEELAAEKVGKEAALFVPSGTMGNTIALKVAVPQGKEILLEEKSHIYNFECGNVSAVVGALPRPLPSQRGKIPVETLKANLHKNTRPHVPETVAVALENTHNYWGGAVFSPDYLKEVFSFTREHNLHLHLDGARIFNAAVYLKVDVKEFTRYVDSIMFCLSKGLSAPIGSMLAGSKEFIQEARKVRKVLGGGMRQVGVIAAAGIVALEEMVDRLEEDHVRAKKLAVGLSEIRGIKIDPEEVQTNIVIFEVDPAKMKVPAFIEELKKRGVLALAFGANRVRMVTHKDIDDIDVERALSAIKEIMSS